MHFLTHRYNMILHSLGTKLKFAALQSTLRLMGILSIAWIHGTIWLSLTTSIS
eukprot:SAG31_NODE_546_length_14230_cov_18.112660_6_plen_53_part_00